MFEKGTNSFAIERYQAKLLTDCPNNMRSVANTAGQHSKPSLAVGILAKVHPLISWAERRDWQILNTLGLSRLHIDLHLAQPNDGHSFWYLHGHSTVLSRQFQLFPLTTG